jgi:hypothetical protein
MQNGRGIIGCLGVIAFLLGRVRTIPNHFGAGAEASFSLFHTLVGIFDLYS